MGNTSSDADEQLGNDSENVLSCAKQLQDVHWRDFSVIASFVVLGLINVMVIVGNTLVIMAVFLSTKLRTVTNLFIVSLAVSDLMVGIAVLPFSTTHEVISIWIFGNIWCKMWLAVDVWMCTASILNLCAISLDRYVAVTRPVSYPSIMSPKRAKILIALVWCVSFVICLPPLVGWNEAQTESVSTMSANERVVTSTTTTSKISASATESHFSKRSLLFSSENDDIFNGDYRDYDSISLNFSESRIVDSVLVNGIYISNNIESNFSATVYDAEKRPKNTSADGGGGASGKCVCLLTTDKGYRIYSALGSFYLPMLVMMFFYWRIYKAAVETTRAINQGFRTTKSGSSVGGRFDEQRLTLRIHRGRSSTDLFGKANGACDNVNVSFRGGSRRVRNSSFKETSVKLEQVGIAGMTFPPSGDHQICAVHISKQPNSGPSSVTDNAHSNRGSSRRKAFHPQWTSFRCSKHAGNVAKMSAYSAPLVAPTDATKPATVAASDNGSTQPPQVQSCSEQDRDTDEQNGGENRKGPQIFSKMGKRNIKAQVKRFRTETKAAKTLGIIVGGFILCWLPFFTIYLIGAFCVDDCISESLFSVFFWLGYCNSAINPCVYALFSRDFRHAFKRILCRCFMKKEHSVKERIVTMFPASLHLASFFEESEDGSNSH